MRLVKTTTIIISLFISFTAIKAQFAWNDMNNGLLPNGKKIVRIYDQTIVDTLLYVVGQSADSNLTNTRYFTASWNGAKWAYLDSNSGNFRQIESDGINLYRAFTSGSNYPIHVINLKKGTGRSIALFDAFRSPNCSVNDLKCYTQNGDTILFLAGSFSTRTNSASGQRQLFRAYMNGTGNLSDISPSIFGGANANAVHLQNDTIFLAGDFGIQRRVSSTWTNISISSAFSPTFFYGDNKDLYLGGRGLTGSAYALYKYNGSSFVAFGPGYLRGTSYAAFKYQDTLYLGGQIRNHRSSSFFKLLKNKGTYWDSTLAQPNNTVSSLVANHNFLFIVGEYDSVLTKLHNGAGYASNVSKPRVRFDFKGSGVICNNDTILFMNRSYGNGTPNWSFQSGNPSSSVAENPFIQFSTIGKKRIRLQVANIFGVDSIIDTVSIQVMAPVSSLDTIKKTLRLCIDDTAQVVANYSQQKHAIQWFYKRPPMSKFRPVIDGMSAPFWFKGATSDTLRASSSAEVYYVVYACGSDTSEVFDIKYFNQTSSSISFERNDQSGSCIGDTLKYRFGLNTNYSDSVRWFLNIGSGFTPLRDTSGIIGSDSNYLIIPMNKNYVNSKLRVISYTVCRRDTGKVWDFSYKVPNRVTNHPTNQSTCAEQYVIFNCNAVNDLGKSIQYYWQFYESNQWKDLNSFASIYSRVSGERTSTLTVRAQTSMNGMRFRAFVAPTNCGISVYTNPATLTVNELSYRNGPGSVDLCIGGNAQFSVTGIGGGITYQWAVKSGANWTPLSNGSKFSGVTTSRLQLTNVSAAENGEYTCELRNSCGSGIVTPFDIVVNTVDIVSVSENQKVCTNDTKELEVQASGNQLSYEWEVNTGGGFGPALGPDYSGASTARLNVIFSSKNTVINIFRCNIKSKQCPHITTPEIRILSEDCTVGTDNISLENVKVFPNPTTDEISISGLDERIDYSLFNYLGEKVLTGTLTSDRKINISELKSGTYLLDLKYFDNTIRKLVIKN